MAERGRERRDLEISVGPYLRDCDGDKLKRYRDAGADQVILTAAAMSAEALPPVLEAIATSLLGLAHRL